MAGSPGRRAPPLLTNQGHPPPLRLLGEEVLGSGACPPVFPAHVPEKGSFLAPGLFSLPGGSSGDRARKKAAKGDREIWKQGPRECLIVLFSPPQGDRGREEPLATVQRGYEEDAVLVLKLVIQLTQQFPVGVVNQHQDSWPHAVSLDEQVRPLFQQILLDPDKEVPDVPGFLLSRQGDLMFLYTIKQELRAASPRAVVRLYSRTYGLVAKGDRASQTPRGWWSSSGKAPGGSEIRS